MSQSATAVTVRTGARKLVPWKRAIAIFGGIIIAPVIAGALAFVVLAAIVPLLLVVFPLFEAFLSRDGRKTWRASPHRRIPAHA
jgi:hypothetical protein